MAENRPPPPHWARQPLFDLKTAAMFLCAIHTDDPAVNLELQDIARRIERIADRFTAAAQTEPRPR